MRVYARCSIMLVLLLAACEPAARGDGEASSPSAQQASGPQQSAQPPADPTEAAILRIRERYQQVERERSGYRCRTLDLDGFSVEGGELKACYDGTELRTLDARFYGESGRADAAFYLSNEHLDFVFRRTERYTTPMSGEVSSREEDRFYFVGAQLVRWLGPDGVPREVRSPEAQEEAERLQKTARQFAACAADQSRTTCEA